nr:efflux RND transporter periplasmic adaptor subunit [Desulfatitalea alkaliphila]
MKDPEQPHLGRQGQFADFIEKADGTVADNRTTLQAADGAAYVQPGVLDFISSTIDPRTGTVSARAVFANPDHELVPGQFVRIRVHLRRLTDVIQIPEPAVGQGPDGPRVFVVGPDDKAASHTVQPGPVVDGRQVILEGLVPGDRVVTVGHVALRDGMPVAVTNVQQTGEAQ